MLETLVSKILKPILSKLIYIGIGFLLALLLFATLCKSEPQTVTTEIPLQEIETLLGEIKTTQKVIRDIKFPKSYTIYLPDTTICIDSATPYGDVPVVETRFDTSFTVKIDDSMKKVDVTFILTHKGEVFTHTFIIHPATFVTDVAAPKAFKLWGNLGVGYSHDGRVPGCLELGLKFKDRISISGQAIYTDRFLAVGWVKVWF